MTSIGLKLHAQKSFKLYKPQHAALWKHYSQPYKTTDHLLLIKLPSAYRCQTEATAAISNNF